MFRIILGNISLAEKALITGIVVCFWILPLVVAVLTLVYLFVPKLELRKTILLLAAPPVILGLCILLVQAAKTDLNVLIDFSGTMTLYAMPLLVVLICSLGVWYKGRGGRTR